MMSNLDKLWIAPLALSKSLLLGLKAFYHRERRWEQLSVNAPALTPLISRVGRGGRLVGGRPSQPTRNILKVILDASSL